LQYFILRQVAKVAEKMDSILCNINEKLYALLETMDNVQPMSREGTVFMGVDVGTANVVSIAVDDEGTPLGGEITSAKVTKEGVIVDYLGAVEIVRRQINSLRERLQAEISFGMSAAPPGTGIGNARVTANILEAAGLEVLGILDEPEAASLALSLDDGVVVDIGGGTTGVSMIRNGKVLRSIDEPTGGFQFDLVIAGHYGLSIEESESLKMKISGQRGLFHVVRPVMEKVATIVKKSFEEDKPSIICLVGGCSAFFGFRSLIQRETGIKTLLPDNPLLVTPYGIALACRLKGLAMENKLNCPFSD
jgi:ethanolamine utilization protein EutJ